MIKLEWFDTKNPAIKQATLFEHNKKRLIIFKQDGKTNTKLWTNQAALFVPRSFFDPSYADKPLISNETPHKDLNDLRRVIGLLNERFDLLEQQQQEKEMV